MPSNPVTIIRIGRPDVRNAVDTETADRLRREFAAFEADPDARVAVLYGDEQAFSSGADLNRLPDLHDDGPLGPTRRIIAKPVVAAIEGWCVAGGLELAAMCDVRVAGDTAKFGFFDRRHGVPLVDGGTVRLPRIIGIGRALDLILTGREFDVAEAHAMGFVNRTVPAGTALTAAVELAELIASHPWNCVISDRAAAYASFELPTTAALQREQELGEDTIFTLDFARRAIARSFRAAAKKAKAALPV
jgi:enoyl-CoA hydratase